MVDRALLEQAKNSPVEERLAIIGELWDSIDHATRPVSAAVATLIDERMADAEANPLDGRPWEEVQESLRERRSR
jgi:putative addiction module component (TIGR02574 family)